MAIYLIDKIKPKNNGTFPMVDAADVEMPDGSRLSDFKGGVTSVNGQTGDVVVPAGEKGEKGDKGDKGDPGATGATGPIGNPGSDGKDGVSPTVTVTAITGGHRVTITDATGTKSFDVMDGEDGQDASITVDSELSDTSTKPVQNKVITTEFGAALIGISEGIDQLAESIPTDDHINSLIDAYLSEALGGDY